jgi:small subunit ribosomal protein S1
VERHGDGEEPISMASIVEQMDAEERGERTGPRRGEIVEGTITAIDRDGILIDIGTKSEGEVPLQEVAELMAGDEPPKVGDAVLAYVIRPENAEGRPLLSLKRGRVERAWRWLENQARAGAIVEAPVVEANRGGLVVDVRGARGFVPMSQIASVRLSGASEEETSQRLQGMVGKSIAMKVVEINPRRGRLILSERQAQMELRHTRKEELIGQLQEGETRRGRVTSVTDFGAFVDIGGADGLVHLSELSWTRVNKASDVVQVGDEVDVMVLGVDRERRKIALSIRRTQPEPWTLAAQKYHPGDVVEGTITRLATFGAFARLEDGVEGLIHISELSEGRIANPRQVVQEGERRRMRVLRVEPERRRLALSLKNVPLVDDFGVEQEPDWSRGYSTAGDQPTIGDAFGHWARSAGEEDDER